jgi:hypothetical protein
MEGRLVKSPVYNKHIFVVICLFPMQFSKVKWQPKASRQSSAHSSTTLGTSFPLGAHAVEASREAAFHHEVFFQGGNLGVEQGACCR